MPIPGSHVTVTSATPVALVASQTHAQNVFLRNSGSNAVFLGDSTVTATGGSRGAELAAGAQTPTIQFDPDETLYAITGAGLESTVEVLQSYSA